MYAIGLFMALRFGSSDLGALLNSAPAIAAAVAVNLLSTVTTTFQDVYSASVSTRYIWPGVPVSGLALALTAIGTLLTLYAPITAYDRFYISSVRCFPRCMRSFWPAIFCS